MSPNPASAVRVPAAQRGGRAGHHRPSGSGGRPAGREEAREAGKAGEHVAGRRPHGSNSADVARLHQTVRSPAALAAMMSKGSADTSSAAEGSACLVVSGAGRCRGGLIHASSASRTWACTPTPPSRRRAVTRPHSRRYRCQAVGVRAHCDWSSELQARLLLPRSGRTRSGRRIPRCWPPCLARPACLPLLVVAPANRGPSAGFDDRVVPWRPGFLAPVWPRPPSRWG